MRQAVSPCLQLGAQAQVEGAAVAIKSAWLILVFSIHLDGRVRQVKRIERDREMFVDLVVERTGQTARACDVLAGALPCKL